MPSKANTNSSKKTNKSEPTAVQTVATPEQNIRMAAVQFAMNLPEVNRETAKVMHAAKLIADFVLSGSI